MVILFLLLAWAFYFDLNRTSSQRCQGAGKQPQLFDSPATSKVIKLNLDSFPLFNEYYSKKSIVPPLP